MVTFLLYIFYCNNEIRKLISFFLIYSKIGVLGKYFPSEGNFALLT